MKRTLPLLLLTLLAQGNPLIAQAQDTVSLVQDAGCGVVAESQSAQAQPSLSEEFTHRFDQAQVDGDLAEAISILRDWDHNLLLQDSAHARLEVAHHAYQLGHERHAAGDLDTAAVLLGHALEIHREIGGRDTYAVWHELAQLHLAARRFDFAQTYIAQALTQLATDGQAAAPHKLAFQQLEGDLQRLQHGYAVAKHGGETAL